VTVVREKLSGKPPQETVRFRALRPQPVSEGADYTDLKVGGKAGCGLEIGGIAASNAG
jgi:hypothetical protein